MSRLRHVTVDEDACAALVGDPMMAPIVEDVAKAVAGAAERNAPRGTGRYARSLHSTGAELVDEVQTAYAYSDDPFAHLIEFGSVNNPPYRPLTKGALDVGLEFKDAVE